MKMNHATTTRQLNNGWECEYDGLPQSQAHYLAGSGTFWIKNATCDTLQVLDNTGAYTAAAMLPVVSAVDYALAGPGPAKLITVNMCKANRLVTLKCADGISGGATTDTAIITFGNLPVGYRPPRILYFPIATQLNSARDSGILKISTDGSCEVWYTAALHTFATGNVQSGFLGFTVTYQVL